MPIQNNPAPVGGEAVGCLLGGDIDMPNTIALRREVLTSRHRVHPATAKALAELAWVTRHG